MKVTTDIIRSEFIGTEGSVAESRHTDYIGVSGELMNETKNTFTIMQAGKQKKIIIYRFFLTILSNLMKSEISLEKAE